MSISVVARKTLWGRAGNMCAFPSCHQQLIQITDELTGQVLAGEGILVGEEAHIRSSKADGPRHDPDYPAAQLDTYANLVLLCPTHHRLVDKDGGAEWPVDQLETLKREHETWVQSRLSADDQMSLQRGVLVAAEVQRLETLLFDRWPNMHWQLSQAMPSLREGDHQALVEAGLLLLAKDWPPQYPRIVEAAERLRQLVALLTQHVNDTFEIPGEGRSLRLSRPEKRLGRWDAAAYAELGHITEVNMAATWWLAEALGMSLNYWIRVVRQELDPLYRFEQGMLLAEDGDLFVSGIRYIRLEYDPESPVPPLPASLEDLHRAISEAANRKDVTPQYVRPQDVDLSTGQCDAEQ